MSKKNKTKKKKQRQRQKKHNSKTFRKQSKQSKRRVQRGGGFFDFIPSPAIDLTRNVLTGFQNFKNQLYGLPLEASRAPFIQPYAQI
jgi:hypothetical protein